MAERTRIDMVLECVHAAKRANVTINEGLYHIECSYRFFRDLMMEESNLMKFDCFALDQQSQNILFGFPIKKVNLADPNHVCLAPNDKADPRLRRFYGIDLRARYRQIMDEQAEKGRIVRLKDRITVRNDDGTERHYPVMQSSAFDLSAKEDDDDIPTCW